MTRLLAHIREDRGAILITVMLTVAIMASVAVLVLEHIRFSVSMTVNSEQADQARWAALGMEDWGRMTLKEWQQMVGADEEARPPSEADMRLTLGSITATSHLAPLKNCFNLNSLVSPDPDGKLVTNTATRNHFIHLMTALGLSSYKATELASATADWIDPDLEMQPSGAEDYEYSGLGIPYRTGNVPLADASELRTIKGFDQETYRMVRPYVCALPHFEPNPINLNRLTQADGPLLAMFFEDSPTRSALDLILAQRPIGGFTDVKTLTADATLTEMARDTKDQELLALKNRFFILKTEATGADTVTIMQSLIDTQAGTDPGIVRRRFGEQT